MLLRTHSNRMTSDNIHNMTMTTTSPPLYYSKNKTPALSIAFFLEAGECSSEGMYDYGDFIISPSLLIKIDDALFIVPSSNRHLLRRRPLNK